MSDFDTCTTGQVVDGLVDQTSRIRLESVEWMGLNNPYANLLEGGTAPANEGETITTIVPERVVLNQNMAIPETIAKTGLCGRVGTAAEYGMTQYTTTLRTIDGAGPLLCVNQAFHKVEQELVTMERGLKTAINELMMSDVRASLLQLSGTKYVHMATGDPLDYITGGENQVQVDFEGSLPTAEFKHKALINLRNLMLEEMGVQPFGNGSSAYAVFIGSLSLIEKMRNETGLQTETRAFVQGSDAEAKAAMRRYTFAEYPYRGIRTAIDPKPLRFNNVDNDGFPIFEQPYTPTVTDSGLGWRTNTAWRTAGWEVSFLVFQNGFRRLVPERYTGEGSARFPAQFAMGELKWVNPQTFECNVWQDYGRFVFRITRAYQAIQPYAVCTILSKRCREDWAQESCEGISEAEA